MNKMREVSAKGFRRLQIVLFTSSCRHPLAMGNIPSQGISIYGRTQGRLDYGVAGDPLDYQLPGANLLNNSAFEDGLSAWTVNNTAVDVVRNDGQLASPTKDDYVLYLANPYDEVTQTLDPAQYTGVNTTTNTGNVYGAYWAFCFDAKAEGADNYPSLSLYANSSLGQVADPFQVQITPQWGRYCAQISTHNLVDPTDVPYTSSVRIVNTAQDSKGEAVGVSLDNIALKRQLLEANSQSLVPFSSTFTTDVTFTNVQTQSVQNVVATVTRTNYQFITASAATKGAVVPTVTATEKTTKTITKKRKRAPKTITKTVAQATQTVTDCTQTVLTFGSKCCPNKNCDSLGDVRLAVGAHGQNRVLIPGITEQLTSYGGYTTTVNAIVLNSATTITVPATQTVQTTQTISIDGQQAVVKIIHKTYTKIVTQPATITKTAIESGATETVYTCDDSAQKSVSCPTNARSNKALRQFGVKALRTANKAARKASDPNVQLKCDGSDEAYQC